MEIIEKIRNHIAKGETENAIKLLVDYTNETQSPKHDEAVLLSGQFKQWKRQANLGVEQSKSDLRRIEMSILNILQEKKAIKEEEASATVTRKTTSVSASASKTIPATESKKSSSMPLLLGVFALLLGATSFYFFNQGSGEAIPIGDPVVTETTEVTTTSKTNNQVPTAAIKTEGSNTKNSISQTASTVSKPLPKVNGRNVNFISFGSGYLRNMGNGIWVEEDANFKSNFEFIEEGRDDFSVYLHDKGRNVKLRPDLHTKKIMYSDSKTQERVQYDIKEALESVKGAQVKKVTYNHHTGKEGSFAKVPNTKTWLESNPDLINAPKQFTEIGRDEWSVYLEDGGGYEIVLDLYQKKVKIKEKGKEFGRLYDVSKAY